MATRMQQRRGTAAQWISTHDGDGPILEIAEIGFETDTGKFKIGDGLTPWINLPYFADVETLGIALDGDFVELSDIGAVSGVAGLDANKNVLVPGNSIIVEGLTNDSYETILTVTDATEDRTITFPNASGTVVLTTTLDEMAQDAVAQALINGSHTNITVSYNDNSNTISLVGAQTYSDEDAVDAVAQALANGTHTNITVSYNDNGNAISLTGASSLPSQTGNGGKFLSTDGTSDAWNYVKIPTGVSESATPAEGQFFFNINSNSLKIYAGGAWLTVGSVSMNNGGPFTSTFETSYDGGSAGTEPTVPQFDGGVDLYA
jgi:hypothetical protein